MLVLGAVSLLRNVFWVRVGTEDQGHVAQSGQSVGLLSASRSRRGKTSDGRGFEFRTIRSARRSTFANLRFAHSHRARSSTTGKSLIRAVSLLRNVFWVRAKTEAQGHVAQSGQSVGLLSASPSRRGKTSDGRGFESHRARCSARSGRDEQTANGDGFEPPETSVAGPTIEVELIPGRPGEGSRIATGFVPESRGVNYPTLSGFAALRVGLARRFVGWDSSARSRLVAPGQTPAAI